MHDIRAQALNNMAHTYPPRYADICLNNSLSPILMHRSFSTSLPLPATKCGNSRHSRHHRFRSPAISLRELLALVIHLERIVSKELQVLYVYRMGDRLTTFLTLSNVPATTFFAALQSPLPYPGPFTTT